MRGQVGKKSFKKYGESLIFITSQDKVVQIGLRQKYEEIRRIAPSGALPRKGLYPKLHLAPFKPPPPPPPPPQKKKKKKKK